MLQIVLNKREKEQLVIKLHQQGKTIREIAHAAHLSYSGFIFILKGKKTYRRVHRIRSASF